MESNSEINIKHKPLPFIMGSKSNLRKIYVKVEQIKEKVILETAAVPSCINKMFFSTHFIPQIYDNLENMKINKLNILLTKET